MKRGRVRNYAAKSLFWYLGNLIFGCVPVIFLGLVFVTSEGKLGSDDMQRQIHGGAILFVCVAMTGGVMIDYLQSETKFGGYQIVFIILMPIIIIGILLLKYLFFVIKIIDTDCFKITSGVSLFILAFSMIYCILNKISLLIMEDIKHE
jgi:hypothetical protein